MVGGSHWNLQFVTPWSEAQVTTGRLKWNVTLWDWALSLCNLILSLGRNCQNGVEFLDSLLASKNCLLVWGNLHTHILQLGLGTLFRDPIIKGTSHFREFYFQEPDQAVLVNIREKFLYVLPAGRGEKEPFWKTPEHSVLNKDCPQDTLVNESLTCWGFIRAWLAWAKGYNKLQPSLAILPNLRGEKTLRNVCEFHSPEA